MEEKRVLSIQSHVVHGYVGNNAATFPLQVLGYEVDAINSVQFSNHTGYSCFKGQVLDSSDLDDIISGLRDNGLLGKYSYILTGYVGSKSFLEHLKKLVTELKETNKNIKFVCDPVLGDNGELYVPKELVEVYKDELVPLADILTPNDFEASLLTGVDIKTETDALKAIDMLLLRGAETVIITSVETKNIPGKLILLAKNQSGEMARVEVPKIPARFTGTGDLFTALLLAWRQEGLQEGCEKALATMHAVLKRTLNHATQHTSAGDESSPEQIELKLIQSKEDIEHPPSLNFITSESSINSANLSQDLIELSRLQNKDDLASSASSKLISNSSSVSHPT